MTTDQKMQLLTILGPSIAGAAGGALGARQQDQQNRMTQQDRMLDWMKNQSNVGMQLQQNRQQQAQVGLNAMPLGLEQQYLQKQRMMQALLPQMAKFQSTRPTDPGIAAAYRPGSNVLAGFASNPQLQQAFSDQATGSSMANYRKLVAQADPRVQFGGLSNYGLDGSFDQEVDDVRLTALADQKSFEQSQQDYAQAQLNMVQQQQNEQKKGGGFWGGVGSVLKVAAPIAAMAIPGVGPVAAAAIAGGGTALGSKMQGQGWGSALGQGVMAGATSGVGKSLAQGKGFNPFNDKANAGAMLLPNGNAVTSAGQVGPKFGEMAAGFEGNNPMLNMPQFDTSAPQAPINFGQQVYNKPAGPYPMENKVKMAITGSQGPPNPMNVQGPPTPPSRQQGIPLNPDRFPVGWSPAPGVIPQTPEQMGSIGPMPRGHMAGLDFQASLDQQPFVQAMRSPIGQLMALASGTQKPQVRGPMAHKDFVNQQNAKRIMDQLSKNNGQNNAELNMAAQEIYKQLPKGRMVGDSLHPDFIRDALAQNQRIRAMILGK